MNANISCTKNCIDGESLAFPKDSYSFEVNSKIETIVPEWRLDDGISSCKIKPALPIGLVIDNSCNIMGEPIETFHPQNYTITAQSSAGSRSANLSIQVTKDGRVSNSKLQFGFIEGDSVDVRVSTIPQYILDQSPISRCVVTPTLPAGLKMSNQCQLSGVALGPTDNKEFTVYSYLNDSERREKIRLSITRLHDSELVYMIDPRRFDGIHPSIASTCISGVNQNVANLSSSSGQGFFSALVGDCETWGRGTGSREDPYQIASTFNAEFLKFNFPTGLDFGFQSHSGSMIYYYKKTEIDSSHTVIYGYKTNSTTSNFFWRLNLFPTNFISLGAVTDLQFYASAGAGTGGSFGSSDKFTPISLDWHQAALTVDLEKKSTAIYYDGQLAKKFQNVANYPELTVDNIILSGNYFTLGNFAVYRRAFSAEEVFQQCQNFENVYGNLVCGQKDIVAMRLNFEDNPHYLIINHCHPFEWKTVNNIDQETTSLTENTFLLLAEQGQYFSDSNCQFPISSITVNSESSSRGRVFFKPIQLSPFKLAVQHKGFPNHITRGFSIGVQKEATEITFQPLTDDCNSPSGLIRIRSNGVLDHQRNFDIYDGNSYFNSMSLPAFSDAFDYGNNELSPGKVFRILDKDTSAELAVITMPPFPGLGCGGGD